MKPTDQPVAAEKKSDNGVPVQHDVGSCFFCGVLVCAWANCSIHNQHKHAVPVPEGGEPRLDFEQRQRAMMIAESRGIDLETAQELVYLRDKVAALATPQ